MSGGVYEGVLEFILQSCGIHQSETDENHCSKAMYEVLKDY